MPFTFNQGGVFQEHLEQLKEILGARKTNKISDEDYADAINEIVKAILTKDEELAVRSAFKEVGLLKEGSIVRALRNFYHYNPEVAGANDKLIKTIEFIQKQKIGGSIYPLIRVLSPNYLGDILDKEKELLQKRFGEVLDVLKFLNDFGGAQQVIQSLEGFEKLYEKNPDYKTLDWEVFYKLMMAKFIFLPWDDKKRLVNIYHHGLEINNFNSIKVGVLYYVCNRDTYHVQIGDQNLGLINLKGWLFERNDLNSLSQDQVEHIARLCAAIRLTAGEEQSTWKMFPQHAQDLFLLERFNQYCQKIHHPQESNGWTLKSLTDFFGTICYKFYWGQIQEKTFFSIVYCCHNQLTKDDLIVIIKAPEFSYSKVELNYQCCYTMAQCSKLKILETENKDTSEQLRRIVDNLGILAEKYATRYLDSDQWLSVLDHIKSLEISKDLYFPILEIFKIRKGPTRFFGSSASGVMQSCYGVKSIRVGSTWKGEKYDLFFNAIQQWIEANGEWIIKNSKDAKDNSKNITRKVTELLSFVKEIKLNEEIVQYNQQQQEACITWMTKLRDIINDPEFNSAFNRLVTLGPKHASGTALILKDLSDYRFTKMNGISFIVNLMRKLIPLGLEELAKNSREVSYLAELESLKFKKILDLPFDLQHEAIECLPEEFKTPYFHLIGRQTKNVNWDPHLYGNLPYPFLSLQYRNFFGQENNVKLLRIATPTGPSGINPEFKVFLENKCDDTENRFLFISLESIQTLLRHKSKNGFFIDFPVKGSFYMQEDEFANPLLYPTFTSFKEDLIKKFISSNKGQVEVNKPGNYLMPSSWLDSGKFKDALETCMDDVKKISFPDTPVLSDSDRRIFIKLFNIRLTFFLISYTNCTVFGFLCNHSADRTGVFNAILLKILTILFENTDETAFGEGEEAFTYDEMGRALVNGVHLATVKRGVNGRCDELTEVLTFLDDPDVQKRLVANKEIFMIQKMSFPDFIF
jgi:hypothetical protein